MKRLLIVLMMFCVPFQMVWAAAAPYCSHEQSVVAAHFGHHAHKHQVNVDQSLDDEKSAEAGSLHSDCGSCHMAAAAFIVQPAATDNMLTATAFDHAEDLYASRDLPVPERPKRHPAPSAVRPGSGGVSEP